MRSIILILSFLCLTCIVVIERSTVLLVQKPILHNIQITSTQISTYEITKILSELVIEGNRIAHILQITRHVTISVIMPLCGSTLSVSSHPKWFGIQLSKQMLISSLKMKLFVDLLTLVCPETHAAGIHVFSTLLLHRAPITFLLISVATICGSATKTTSCRSHKHIDQGYTDVEDDQKKHELR